ncbi:MAG: hypothetical protein R2784_04945 [Saprospiraceae bacterium]
MRPDQKDSDSLPEYEELIQSFMIISNRE